MAVLPCPHCQIPIFPAEVAAGFCPVCNQSLNLDAPPVPTSDPPALETPAPRRSMGWPIAAGVGVAGLMAGSLWLWQGTRPETETVQQTASKPEPVAADAPKASAPFSPGPAPLVHAKLRDNGPGSIVPRAEVKPGLDDPKDSSLARGENKPGPATSAVEAAPPKDSFKVRDGPDLVSDLIKLASMPALRDLDLGNTQVLDKDLELLKGLPELRTLSLRGTKVSGPGLEHLVGLTSLDLSETPIIDRGLANLVRLTQLRKLSLAGTKVTGPGLARLVGLNSLDLSRTQLTDPGLVYLRGMTDLRELRLKGTHVHGPGLENLKSLHRLDLGDCPVADKGLQSLHGLNHLRWLDLSGTKVTDEAVRALQARLPALEIIR
jgi:Leucine-rich repeat (LRR) protein